MDSFWSNLISKVQKEEIKSEEKKLYKKLSKAIRILAENPKHPGLKTHEIKALSRRYGIKVWQSYLENNTPSAGRIFWVYGPDQKDITIIGLEPHPEDKKDGFEKIKLSNIKETKN
jgi:hypothetical protein